MNWTALAREYRQGRDILSLRIQELRRQLPLSSLPHQAGLRQRILLLYAERAEMDSALASMEAYIRREQEKIT